ncbi:hypothetical protein TWF569_011116 [Orbilia oligospora]|uniref:Uncharacterized protein n=1 Tax=Orbilia oligospora TaxID=2813651 RepID=A0A7C8JE52_ORBOL|nr:hypothetical protein TWF706_005000 [Orbilia oligospora]KAF3107134.1 hypothetical protein TWF102_000967 [Orbilia oligospora]KAF3108445.1 hypothetical protein TWF103_005528 [Orbilia oligospora]KAF3131670.1 hypothetical protein TWF569_011116 [Orbilia oligospora]KAF3139860.1 hypothetical protein TWF703_003438 [Orbilia oligospora]
MGDPYRSYRPSRGEPRYDYPDEYEYPPYPGRSGAPEPVYDRSYGDPYTREPGYDPMPPAPRSGAPRGDYRAPRGDYRAPPPIRAEPDYTRRSGRDYVPPPAPRGSVGDPYVNPTYYPPEDRHRAPPPRDAYERGYPPESGYRDEARYGRRRPREDEYEMPAHGREYDYNYESEIQASQRRPPPPPIEYRGGAGASYEVEPARRRPRDAREPASKLQPSIPSQPSPENVDDEFTLLADGIRKEVLQKYITRFLGNDAVSRGPMKEGDALVYKYSAYRQFTTEQIRDLKRASELSEPGYARGIDARAREAPGQVVAASTRPTGRRNTDEDSMMPEPVMPRDEYVYSAGNQGTRAPAREIRAGRSPHDPPYGSSYHDTGRHGRPPIEASSMRPGQDDDDEMED